jgi:hypothetical protein
MHHDLAGFGFDLIDDAIITYSNPVESIRARQFYGLDRKRDLREPLDRFEDTGQSLLGDPAKIFLYSRFELDFK